MKVRIGNDIRFNLTIKGPKNYDLSNVKQMRAYLINTSMKEFTEPWMDPCMGCCGCHKYHRLPYDTFRADYVGDHCEYLSKCPHGCADGMHCWHYDWRSPMSLHPSLRPNYGHPWHCDDHACHCAHTGIKPGACDCAPIPAHVNEEFKFLAPSKMVEGRNKAQVYFPASDQFACGEYKLVIVLVVYENGWGRCDLHTYTIDYGKVVTLVDDGYGVNGDVTIDVDTDSLVDGDIVGIEFESQDLHLYTEKSISLNGTDNRGVVYKVKVLLKNGSAAIDYNPKDWEFTPLKFQSTNQDVVQIAPNGTIIAKNPLADSSSKIIVTSADGSVEEEFTVFVHTHRGCQIGFAPVRPMYTIDRADQSFEDNYPNSNLPSQEASGIAVGAKYVDLSTLKTVQDIEGTFELVNNADGNYLWIVSDRPISSVISGFGELPMSYPQLYNDMYYYTCLNPLKANTIDNEKYYIKVKC